jgi:hypothetical protein
MIPQMAHVVGQVKQPTVSLTNISDDSLRSLGSGPSRPSGVLGSLPAASRKGRVANV